MINAKRVRETISTALGDDAALLKDFSDVVSFATVLSNGQIPSVAVAIVLISKTAGACLDAALRLIHRCSPASPDISSFDNAYARFRVLFYVTCQQAYIESVIGSPELEALTDHRDSEPIPARITTFTEHLAELDEAEVRFHYTVDPSSTVPTLFEAYGRWLRELLGSLAVDAVTCKSIATAIANNARLRLKIAISADTPESVWMRNFLALGAMEASEQSASDLSAIRATLDGWKGSNLRDTSREVAWTAYKKHLQRLPDERESMYDETFGVSKVFVKPAIGYHRAGLQNPDIPVQLEDPWPLLAALISNRSESDDLIVVSGGPGSGKSTLCRILVSELARDPEIHPIFLRLRRAREGSELGSFIEDSLIKEGLINRISDLRNLPNVVIVLDGFDELVLASRTRLKHVFGALQDDLKDSSLRGVRVIIAGRDTLFPKGEGLPRNSHVINLLPFDRTRIERWGARWRELHTGGPGATFHPEVLTIASKSKGRSVPPLQQLVSWPLTLHLLARVHTTGLFDISSIRNSTVEKAYLYRGILHETAARQNEKLQGEGRLEPSQLRRFLRLVAWEMYRRSVDSLEPNDIIPIAKKFFPTRDDVAIVDLADVAIVSAPEIQSREDTSVEFVHKSFTEFLVAELIAEMVDDVCHRVSNVAGDNVWQYEVAEAGKRAAIRIGLRPIPAEVQEMLEPMLGSFQAFSKGSKVNDLVAHEARTDGLKRVHERFGELHSELLQGQSIPEMHTTTRDEPLVRSILDFVANFGQNVVLIGAASARRLKREASIHMPFGLNPFEGSFWRWLLLTHTMQNVDTETAKRMFDCTTVRASRGVDPAFSEATFPVKLSHLQQIAGFSSEVESALGQFIEVVDACTTVFLTAYSATSAYALRNEQNERHNRSELRDDRLYGEAIDEHMFDHLSRHMSDRINRGQSQLAAKLVSLGITVKRRRDADHGIALGRLAGLSNDELRRTIVFLSGSLCREVGRPRWVEFFGTRLAKVLQSDDSRSYLVNARRKYRSFR
jgi:hypothetical protein